MEIGISLDELANGAALELFEREMRKVAENIIDPNTPWKAKRKIVLTVTISPDRRREASEVEVDVKSTLAAVNGVSTQIAFGVDGEGKAQYAELLSGERNQFMIDKDGGIGR
ncbi:replication terminator protein [Paenibacillus lentus]|uniref:replication terminator protein n=1 Tax=Paenibacillus lentus TaxID=1338368 RepID=UPI00364E18C6